MSNAIRAAGASAEEPIAKQIVDYSPTGTKIHLDKFGQRNTPIGLIDANTAIIEALSKAQEALYQKWLAYNKMPDLPSGSPEDADPKLDPTQKFGMRDLGSGPAMTDLGVERKSPSGTFDDDGNYIPPGFEDAIKTNEIGKPEIDPFKNEIKPGLGAGGDGQQLAMATYGGKVDPWDKILNDINKAGENLKNQPEKDYPYHGRPGRGMGDRWKVQNNMSNLMTASYQKSGRVLSESRKHIIREIKKPTTLPEAKKKYKVKPKVLGHPSNNTLSDQMKDTTPNVAFKKEIPVWSMDQKIRNARSSQEKKNEVLEYLGSSGDHWNYMTKTIKEHNKKIINLNYGGKKKVTRKEQVDKDTLVFMEDEDGSKTNILQSKINEMQAEAGDKEMFAKYYEMNPQKKSLFKEVVKRGVFDYPKKPSKKGYPDKEPAQLDPKTGMHPEYGKKYKHDKLDPHSAESMPMQGDPEIDANIAKNVDQEKKKRKSKILSQPNG